MTAQWNGMPEKMQLPVTIEEKATCSWWEKSAVFEHPEAITPPLSMPSAGSGRKSPTGRGDQLGNQLGDPLLPAGDSAVAGVAGDLLLPAGDAVASGTERAAWGEEGGSARPRTRRSIRPMSRM